MEEDEIGDVKWKVDDESKDDFKSFYQADSSSSPSSTQNRDVKKPITLVQLKKPDEYVMDDNVAEGSGNGPPYNETNYGKYESPFSFIFEFHMFFSIFIFHFPFLPFSFR